MPQRKIKRSDELIDEMLAESGLTPEAVFGESRVFGILKKRVIKRALAGELTHHLGYSKGEAPAEVDNHRNGHSRKTITTGDGAMEIAVPRDRKRATPGIGGFQDRL